MGSRPIGFRGNRSRGVAMKQHLPWSLLVLVFAGSAQAREAPPAQPAGKLIKETWDAAYLEGARTGYFHTTVREIERDGQKLYVSTLEMSLTIKRFNDVVKLRMQSGTEENAD